MDSELRSIYSTLRKEAAATCHSIEKEHTLSVTKMKKAKHQVNVASRKAQCHLKYSQWLSLISSTDGTWSPTLVQYKNAMWVTKCSWDGGSTELFSKTKQTNSKKKNPYSIKKPQNIHEQQWQSNDKVTKNPTLATAAVYDWHIQ